MAEYAVDGWRALGAAAKDARRLKGLSQAEVAEKAGVSRAWLAKLESGTHRRAELEQVFRLMAALDLTVSVRDQRRSAGESEVLAALANSRVQFTKRGEHFVRDFLNSSGHLGIGEIRGSLREAAGEDPPPAAGIPDTKRP
jgi:HTH-type transcriptional regulator/antitoxin HipB